MTTMTKRWNALERAEELAEFWATQDPLSEERGYLTDATAQALRDTGVVRMLQPTAFGGEEAAPADFLRAVLSIGSHSGSAGWVAGVVGVHAHEIALGTKQVQEEIWGDDADTWVASPYAPLGRATPVAGGFRFSGRWPFSSGTDHCTWVILGGFVVNEDGSPNRGDLRHFVLPRSDYEIDHDSWNVMGLRGTGSKDIIVNDVFVPAHRVVETRESALRDQIETNGLPWGTYATPRRLMFSGAVNAATLAMTQGVLAGFIASVSRRVDKRTGAPMTSNPHQLTALGEAAADIETSINTHLVDFERAYDAAATGQPVPMQLRMDIRKNQVRNVARAGRAADILFAHAGGSALRQDLPIQRMWRDLHAGLQHNANQAELWYHAYGSYRLGQGIPAGILI